MAVSETDLIPASNIFHLQHPAYWLSGYVVSV